MAKEYFQGEVFDALDPGSVLRGVEYNDCTFKNCRWDGVRIENCSFLSCTFEHCTWSGVVFSFSQMSDAWFSGCAFRSVAWGGLQGRSALVQPFGKAERCEFRYNEFSGMTLTRFDFSSCRFGDCTFDDCKLVGRIFAACRWAAPSSAGAIWRRRISGRPPTTPSTPPTTGCGGRGSASPTWWHC